MKYEDYLELVKANGRKLELVPEQYKTNEMCMAAVRKDGYALKYIKNQTEKMCIAAAQNYSHSLMFVITQTPQICLAAIMKNPTSIFHVKDLSSIALLVNDDYIKKHLNDYPEFEELKDLKSRMLISNKTLLIANESIAVSRKDKVKI